MNTIDHIYYRPPSRTSKGFMYWLAAHGINARKYQWDQALADQVKPFTGHRLCVYLVKGGIEYNRKPEAELTMQNYLFKQTYSNGILNPDLILELAKMASYVVTQNYAAGAIQFISSVFGGQRPDILFRYNTLFENLSSNEVNQQFYSSFSQAGLLKAVDASGSNVKWKRYFKLKGKTIDLATGVGGTSISVVFKQIKELKFLASDANFVSSGATLTANFLLALYYGLTQPDIQFYNQVFGFGEYYGHYLADRQYGIQADGILDQKRERINSTSSSSSHKLFLETWNPNLGIDDEIDYKVGMFYDMLDLISDQVPSTPILDIVINIKPKNYEKSLSGQPMWGSPELWYQVKENLIATFPTQTTGINLLYQAYNIP